MSLIRSTGPSTVVAFASASRPLYRRDVLNTLCYPRDWVVRLTYQAKWIEKSLKRDIQADRLRERDILITFCGDVDQDTKKFAAVVPLRFGKVISSAASPDGISVLRIALKDRPNQDYLATGASLLPAPLKDSGSYLTSVPYPTMQRGQECDWDALANEILRAPEMKECRVFHILNREGSVRWRRGSLPRVVRSRASDVTILKVSAGRSYNLSFCIPELSYRPSEEVPIHIAIKGEHLEIAEPVVYQRGPGAEVSYLLVVQRKYAAEQATLVARAGAAASRGGPGLSLPPELKLGIDGALGGGKLAGDLMVTLGSSTPEGKRAPEFQALLRISPPAYFWPVTIGLLTLGLFGLNMPQEALQGVFGPSLSNPEFWLAVVKAGGAMILAIAGAWAFRRLPVKV